MENTNEMELIFDSSPVNEGLARVTVAAFCTQLNPTLEEVADLKTAVSEAVTNCIIHATEEKKVVVQGLDGYIVAEKGDTLLVCKISEEQRIRQFAGE